MVSILLLIIIAIIFICIYVERITEEDYFGKINK
jgi:hypothetical protein